MVLDRLERADRHAELLALVHVVDGQVEHPPAEADELRGGAERAAVEGAAAAAAVARRPTARRRRATRRRVDRSTGAVDRRPRLGGQRRRGGQRHARRSRSQQDGIGPRRHQLRRRSRPDDASTSDRAPSVQSVAAEQRARRRTAVSTSGCGSAGVAGLLEQQHQSTLVEARARRAPRARRRRARPSRPAPSTPRRPVGVGPSPRPASAGVVAVGPRGAHDLGGHSLASRSRTASRNASWSSVKANRIGDLLPRAGRARARRRCCAGSRSCRRRSGPTSENCQPFVHGPSSSASGPSRSSAVSCSATSSSDHQSLLRLDSAPGGRPSTVAGDGRERVEPVGLGLDPRLRSTRSRSDGSLGAARSRYRSTSRSAVGHEPARRPQREPALGRRRRHRDRPALAHLAEHDAAGDGVVGDERLVEEHLGEALVAVEPAEAAHGHARRSSGTRK